MYEISEDGKTITKKEDIDLLNSGMTYDDMQGSALEERDKDGGSEKANSITMTIWTTLQFSGALYCTDLYKDQDTLYALGAEWYEDRGRLAAIRWIKDEKRTEFAADLLTAEFMKDTGSDIGVLSVYGNNAYYGETGSTDKGRVMEYQFKYE
ncbi:hypothetical protein OS493_009304 [Desmophyllum pertusum]|uniref:Uncharacterized protein n=1 Tax=Desmophyllum pertusum TaxID=174260 RepID=A0A9X0CSL3_9CNID|nr:hypothetical protein OS493_009304 [Desmophyllum pertusum]